MAAENTNSGSKQKIDVSLKNIDTFNGNSTIGDNHMVYAKDTEHMNINQKGQWGELPYIGDGSHIDGWMNEQAYQKNNIIPIVLQVPKFLGLLKDSAMWITAFKNMIEVHAKNITGLDSSLTAATNDHALGFSGANFKEPSDMTRAESNVSITLQERIGNPFEILLDLWMRYGIMDPDLKAPLITNYVKDDRLPYEWTTDWYTMTVLFIEPDALYSRPVHAWLVSNLFPTSNPDITGQKDKSAAKALKEMSIELGGFAIPSTNKYVYKLAENLMQEMNLYAYAKPDTLTIGHSDVNTGIASKEFDQSYYTGKKYKADKTTAATGGKS